MAKPYRQMAIFGGTPAFDAPVPVGQLNFPPWEDVEKSLRGIFERRYYTNHGPLLQELEARLEDFLGVRHAICMTNATIALMISAVALELRGKVLTPAFTYIATAQSLSWAGLEPVFCDVEPDTHNLSPASVRAAMVEDVSAILAVHLWSNPCSVNALESIANEFGVKLWFDAAQAFGSGIGGRLLGGCGEVEIFSFHATKIINGMEGGCACTNDDELAARLRNIRSSYGAGSPVKIPYTGNGRMSEAQAAMALLSLDGFNDALERNRSNQLRYRKALSQIPGISFPTRLPGTEGNDQYVVVMVDEEKFGLSRDQLSQVLNAENVLCRRYFKPGVHRCPPYARESPEFQVHLPVTDHLCETVVQLPSGMPVSVEKMNAICDLIAAAHENSSVIRNQLQNLSD